MVVGLVLVDAFDDGVEVVPNLLKQRLGHVEVHVRVELLHCKDFSKSLSSHIVEFFAHFFSPIVDKVADHGRDRVSVVVVLGPARMTILEVVVHLRNRRVK